MRWWLAIGLLVLGCSSGDSSNERPAVSTGFSVKTYSLTELPIGDYLPSGVSSHVGITAPLNWRVPGRRAGYLAWFIPPDSTQIPLILVQDFEPAHGQFSTVDRSNAQNYASAVQARLRADEQSPLEELTLIGFEDRFFVRYVLEGQVGGRRVERQILETQVYGRRYLVELRVRPGTITDHRDAGYAVAASMRFFESAGPEETGGDTGEPQDSSAADPATHDSSGDS